MIATCEFSHLTDTGQIFIAKYKDYEAKGKAPMPSLCRQILADFPCFDGVDLRVFRKGVHVMTCNIGKMADVSYSEGYKGIKVSKYIPMPENLYADSEE